MEWKMNTVNPNIAMLPKAAQMRSITTKYWDLEQAFIGCFIMLFYYPQMIISPDGEYYWDYNKQRWIRLPNSNWFLYFLLGFIAAVILGRLIAWATQ